ncbi:hypothetical protein ACO0QE_000489 [Hanseniaspora vineae]
MFASKFLTKSLVAKSVAAKSLTQIRPLHSSLVPLYAKKSKKSSSSSNGSNNDKAASTETPADVLDPKDFKSRISADLTKLLEQQKKALAETAKGRNDVKIFDNLTVGKEKFTNVASTSQKGKNLLIVTVFDPKNSKNVVSAILGANLNLNPEKIPDNDQQLKVVLPPVTQESRNQTLKVLKKYNDEFKSGAFANVRNKYLKELKPYGFKNEDAKKCSKEIEKVHKDFGDKLLQQYKSVEKLVQQG